MRTELSFILLLSVSIGLAGARPQAVDQGKKAQDGQSCGSPKALGKWRSQDNCPRGLIDWMTTGGERSELECCYEIPCSETTGGKFQGYCMSINANGGFDVPKNYMTVRDDRCQATTKSRAPNALSNEAISFNPSNTPGRCVVPSYRHSDALGGEETGYINPVDQLVASNLPEEPVLGEESPEYQEAPNGQYGTPVAQFPTTDEPVLNFDDFE